MISLEPDYIVRATVSGLSDGVTTNDWGADQIEKMRSAGCKIVRLSGDGSNLLAEGWSKSKPTGKEVEDREYQFEEGVTTPSEPQTVGMIVADNGAREIKRRKVWGVVFDLEANKAFFSHTNIGRR